ncbi:hypothetical protein [Glaciimonas soli]|uniref:Uncharacterized protein n=1 Tax=Glaciimonas soli TaxID=2590999 RepID=A0A843YR10_9BURK|nr:hypothetical protein [Glaciimonas soli]MQQ99820.1 hypothetical protein [Glaciimonas soli]
MSIGTKEYTLLAKDSYEDRSNYVGKEKFVILDGAKYRVLDTYSDPITGYQGTESLLDGAVDPRIALF